LGGKKGLREQRERAPATKANGREVLVLQTAPNEKPKNNTIYRGNCPSRQKKTKEETKTGGGKVKKKRKGERPEEGKKNSPQIS